MANLDNPGSDQDPSFGNDLDDEQRDAQMSELEENLEGNRNIGAEIVSFEAYMGSSTYPNIYPDRQLVDSDTEMFDQPEHVQTSQLAASQLGTHEQPSRANVSEDIPISIGQYISLSQVENTSIHSVDYTNNPYNDTNIEDMEHQSNSNSDRSMQGDTDEEPSGDENHQSGDEENANQEENAN
ncbi:hypothetical protein PT974_01845 [Cladobotryum mycophilum]|uniref:Uncharacterized protein n=1 Tax=Cladobotryum mycophilum TaxID=491253 RepID=A0ABR0SXJ6_9HYPO